MKTKYNNEFYKTIAKKAIDKDLSLRDISKQLKIKVSQLHPSLIGKRYIKMPMVNRLCEILEITGKEKESLINNLEPIIRYYKVK